MRLSETQSYVIQASTQRSPAWSGGDGFAIVAAFTLTACLVATIGCLHQGLTAPLWFDESWTGTFASEPSLSSLAGQIRDDNNAPLYYGVIWFWARVFGVSNLSLHVPSVLFCVATPAVAWFGLRKSRPWLALVWAALLSLWIPGITLAGDARCYTLLTCLSVATSVAAIGAFDKPTRGRAIIWAVGACLMTLTHYYAALLALAQGAALIGYHRRRIRDVWPATLVFLPAAAWMGWHAPRLAAYARPDVVWYDPLTLADLPLAFEFLLGSRLALTALAAALAVSLLLPKRADAHAPQAMRTDRAVLATGLASLAAVGLCLGLAALRSTFTIRYLTPFAPGLLLLVAIGVVIASRSRWQPLAVLIGGSIIGVSLALASEDPASSRTFGFETASAWIAESAPSRLAFFWDNPTTVVETAHQLDTVGGFFLRRAGLAVEVDPVFPVADQDMNDAVLAAAGPDGAILWLYDKGIRHTSAVKHPPRLDGSQAGLECRDFGRQSLGVLACRRAGR